MSFPAVLCLLAGTATGKKTPFVCAGHSATNPACRKKLLFRVMKKQREKQEGFWESEGNWWQFSTIKTTGGVGVRMRETK